MRLIDIHAHLTDAKYDDLKEVVERANEKYVDTIVCSSYDITSSLQSLKIAKDFKGVYVNVGIHPENVDCFEDSQIEKLKELAKLEKVVAIGEIGLDYHYTSENKDLQKEVFRKQIALANEFGLPIVVHSRDAIGDTIELLKKFPPQKESLLHCYSGSIESAEVFMKMGFSFSFGGVCTFANAKSVVEVIKKLPIEKILLETDCPYLAPVPFRGQRNEPKNIVYIADMIAKIKGISIEEVAQKTCENAKRLFNI